MSEIRIKTETRHCQNSHIVPKCTNKLQHQPDHTIKQNKQQCKMSSSGGHPTTEDKTCEGFADVTVTFIL